MFINKETATKELYERLLASKDQQIAELKEIIAILKSQKNWVLHFFEHAFMVCTPLYNLIPKFL